MATNARVILMLVSIATGLRSTLESISAPNSVNANGRDFLGLFILDVITNCDEIRSHSFSVSWNKKSVGKDAKRQVPDITKSHKRLKELMLLINII